MLHTEFVHLVKRLQRRKLKSEKLTDNGGQVMAIAHMAGELKRINNDLQNITQKLKIELQQHH